VIPVSITGMCVRWLA